MILPRGHCVTKLIVKHYHEQANHIAGTNFVLSQINKKYWIIAAREEIREWERECNMCKRMRGKTTRQIMAPIPEICLCFTFRPFDQTAVDYAGPFTTVQGRGVRHMCFLTWFLFSKLRKYLLLLSLCSCQRARARITIPWTFSS